MDRKAKQSAPQSFPEIEESALIFNAEQGKVYHFTKRSIEVIRLANPYPAAYRKSFETNNWQCYIPSKPFPFLFNKPHINNLSSAIYPIRKNAQNKESVYKKMVAYVGEDKIALLNLFSDRFWFIYCLLVREGNYAVELMNTNPALGYLLSAPAVFHPLKSKKYWQAVNKLVKMKRKDILGYFGFPACETMVKTFAKIKPELCSVDLLVLFRTALQNYPAILRQLSFWEVLNSISLYIYCNGLGEILNHNLIADISTRENEEKKEIIRWIEDICRILDILKAYKMNVPKHELLTMNDLNAIHDKLLEEMLQIRDVIKNHFPEPPLPDIKCNTLWIEHIQNSAELYIEGSEMHHCIYSYTSNIQQGKCYVAKMLYPERLTIMYKETPKEGLKLIETHGKCNSKPASESIDLIELWLKGYFIVHPEPEQPVALTSIEKL
jgi:hypothetical protein